MVSKLMEVGGAQTIMEKSDVGGNSLYDVLKHSVSFD